MVETTEWKVDGACTINVGRNVFYDFWLSVQRYFSVVACIVGFTSGWNVLERWITTRDDCAANQ